MWTPSYIVAFILGIVLIILAGLTYLTSSRKNTLILKFITDVISIINLILINSASGDPGVWSAMALCCVGLLRDITFMFKGKYKWCSSYIYLCILCLVFGLSLIWTYSSWISILPTIGTIVNTIGLFLKEVKKTKILTLIGQTFYITYFAILIPGSDLLTILNMISSIMFFVGALVGLILIFIKEHKEKTQKNI